MGLGLPGEADTAVDVQIFLRGAQVGLVAEGFCGRGGERESFVVLRGSSLAGMFRSIDSICRSLSVSRAIMFIDIARGVLGFFVRPTTTP